jgi:hypothetical protein
MIPDPNGSGFTKLVLALVHVVTQGTYVPYIHVDIYGTLNTCFDCPLFNLFTLPLSLSLSNSSPPPGHGYLISKTNRPDRVHGDEDEDADLS